MRPDVSRSRVCGVEPLRDGDIRRDESLRGDNTDAWEERCKPVIALLRISPSTLSEIRAHFRRDRDCEKLGSGVAEECLYWLEARDRVYRDDDRKWRLK